MDKEHVGSANLDFVYLGSRNYVNGLTIFEEMIKAFMLFENTAISRPTYIKQFKVKEFLRTNARMEILMPQSGLENIFMHPWLKTANGRIDLFTAQKKAFVLLLFGKPDEPVNKSAEEYDRGNYISDQKIFKDRSAVSKLTNLGNVFDLLRGIVEVNQRLSNKDIKELINRNKSYWAYMKDFKFVNTSELYQVREIHFSPPVFVHGLSRVFTIRKVKIMGLAGAPVLEIGYFA